MTLYCANNKEIERMRILFIGDVVGRSGRTIVIERLPGLIAAWKLDLVVVNGENSAGGFGITEVIYNELIDAGADAITLGKATPGISEGACVYRAGACPDPPSIPRKGRRAAARLIDARTTSACS